MLWAKLKCRFDIDSPFFARRKQYNSNLPIDCARHTFAISGSSSSSVTAQHIIRSDERLPYIHFASTQRNRTLLPPLFRLHAQKTADANEQAIDFIIYSLRWAQAQKLPFHQSPASPLPSQNLMRHSSTYKFEIANVRISVDRFFLFSSSASSWNRKSLVMNVPLTLNRMTASVTMSVLNALT